MRNKLIILFSLFCFSLHAQIGGNIKLLNPAPGEGYTVYTDSTGRQMYVLFSSLVDDSTGLDARVDSMSFDTMTRNLTLYYNDTSLQNIVVELPIIKGEKDTTVSVANLQLFSTQPVIVEGDTVGLKVEMSHNGGEFWLMTENKARIKIRKRGHYAYFDTVDKLNADSLNGRDSSYYLIRLASLHFITETGVFKAKLTNGDSLEINLDGRYLQHQHLRGVRDTLDALSDSIMIHRDSILKLHTRIRELEQAVDDDNQTLSFTLPNLSISGGNTLSLSSLREWTNIVDKPSTFPASAHSHTEAEITDLTHYNLAMLLTEDGTGSLLDADLLDGQSGAYYLNYNNLTSKPSLFSGSWDDLTDIPSGFLDNIDDNNFLNLVSFNTSDNIITLHRSGLPSLQLNISSVRPFWNNIVNKPSAFPASAHSHVEADITNLQHYTDADIDGNETAFDAWDKNAADDFNGSWNSLSDIPGGFADGTDNNTLYFPDNSTITMNGAGVFSLKDNSNASSVGNTGNTFIQSLTLDAYGRILSIGSATSANNYPVGFQFSNNNLTLFRSGLSSVSIGLGGIQPAWSNISGIPAGFSDGVDDTGADGNNYPIGLSFDNASGNLTMFRNGLNSLIVGLNGLQLPWSNITSKPTLFSGSWNDLSSIPSGFSDGVDNNNYPVSLSFNGSTNFLSISRSGTSSLFTDLSSIKANWNNLTNVPSDIADGDNTTRIGYQDVQNGADPYLNDLTNLDELHISIYNTGPSESQLLFPTPSASYRGKKVYITSFSTSSYRITTSTTGNLVMYKGAVGSVEITDDSATIVTCMKLGSGNAYYWQVFKSN